MALALSRAGLGTLLFDLLTPEEERDRATSSTSRCSRSGCGWRPTGCAAPRRASTATTPLGYFGASTGAAAALTAAAEPDADVAAVVSRGGRPDLAGSRLPDVRCPTLLIVGGDDQQVLTLNRRAQSRLTCPSRLVVVRGATHLFEEKGALERVADLARDWFLTHLAHAAPVDPRRPGAAGLRPCRLPDGGRCPTAPPASDAAGPGAAGRRPEPRLHARQH